MKRVLHTIFPAFIACTSFAQSFLDIDLEDTAIAGQYVMLDTVSLPNNDWRIGHPDKPVFNAAHSGDKVIATKLSGTYTASDTSSFVIRHEAFDGWQLQYPKVDIGGYYWVNSDTILDYGFIDISVDHGATWINVDSTIGYCTWGAVEELPVLTGNSGGWKHFYICIDPPQSIPMGDTVLYRFNFVSDTIPSDKDGLMFDDLHFEDWAEGIPEHSRSDIDAYLIPAINALHVHSSSTHAFSIEVMDLTGRTLLPARSFVGQLEVDVSMLATGAYLLHYTTSDRTGTIPFQKQ